MDDTTTKLLNQFPFISFLTYGGNEYLGIIQNCDQYITNVYDYGKLISASDKQLFLELGEVWWWESNRRIPINIFLKKEMQFFRYAIKTFNSKDAELVFGPTVNLSEIAEKRIKRRSIQLIRIPPKR